MVVEDNHNSWVRMLDANGFLRGMNLAVLFSQSGHSHALHASVCCHLASHLSRSELCVDAPYVPPHGEVTIIN